MSTIGLQQPCFLRISRYNGIKAPHINQSVHGYWMTSVNSRTSATKKEKESSVKLQKVYIPEIEAATSSKLQLDRQQPQHQVFVQENRLELGQFVACEAQLDREYWQHGCGQRVTGRIRNERYAHNYKRKIAEQVITTAAVATVILAVAVEAKADVFRIGAQQQQQEQEESGSETLSNVPQTLSSECTSGQEQNCRKARIQRPKSRKAEACTVKCVTTCIRGGLGSPGEGPLNVRRPLVVFKEGFRSRQYCLVECSDICNLIGDGNDGP